MSHLENFHHHITTPDKPKKLVFLHGLMGSAANWRGVTPAFSDEFQILTYDQRGHGRSFQPDGPYTPEVYAEDLLQILDELGWEKVYLVGHSMGGRNSLSFASQHANRVEKLVIEDISATSSYDESKRIVDLLDLVPTPFASKTAAREFFQSGKFEQQIPSNPNAKALGQYFYSNIHEKPNGTGDWRFSRPAMIESVKAAHQRDRWELVSQLSSPTLVVRGELSENLSQQDLHRYSKENSMVETVEVAGAGHWVHFDQREQFIQCLQRFFSS